MTPGEGEGTDGAGGAVAPVATGPVSATAVEVFSPQGTPDSPATASQAIDGDPSTEWSTDAYFDPFPSLKNGVGLLVTLADTSTLSSVTVTTDSPGTVLEVRSAPSAQSSLDQTQVIGSAHWVRGRPRFRSRPMGAHRMCCCGSLI